MMQTFDDYATYLGTYSDEKLRHRRFDDYEDFQDLHPRVKDKLIDKYKKLELNLTEVKK
jgi:hypothetical protein